MHVYREMRLRDGAECVLCGNEILAGSSMVRWKAEDAPPATNEWDHAHAVCFDGALAELILKQKTEIHEAEDSPADTFAAKLAQVVNHRWEFDHAIDLIDDVALVKAAYENGVSPIPSLHTLAHHLAYGIVDLYGLPENTTDPAWREAKGMDVSGEWATDLACVFVWITGLVDSDIIINDIGMPKSALWALGKIIELILCDVKGNPDS